MKKSMLISSLVLTGTIMLSGHAFAQGQQQGQQGSIAWQQEIAQGQSAALTIAPSTVRQIQLRLNQQGFDPGNIDGVWGQSTSQALQHFQLSRGLEPTGQINLSTLNALGIGLSGQQQYGIAPQFGQQQPQQFQQRPQQFQQRPQQFQQQPQQFQQQPQQFQLQPQQFQQQPQQFQQQPQQYQQGQQGQQGQQ